MTFVWLLLVVVVVVTGYFLLKVVKKLNRTMGALVDSMSELGEVATELQRLRGELAPEQNGSVDDPRRQ